MFQNRSERWVVGMYRSFRQSGGPNLIKILALRLALYGGFVGLAILSLYLIRANELAAGLIGFFAGGLLNELVGARRLSRAWPTILQITD